MLVRSLAMIVGELAVVVGSGRVLLGLLVIAELVLQRRGIVMMRRSGMMTGCGVVMLAGRMGGFRHDRFSLLDGSCVGWAAGSA